MDVSQPHKLEIMKSAKACGGEADLVWQLHELSTWPRSYSRFDENDMLTIRGEKRSEETSGDGGQRWTERTYGKVERNISLPTEGKADVAKAEFKNGQLRFTLPKSEGARRRAHIIPIR
jgi:Hsp20/alpha crystallin family